MLVYIATFAGKYLTCKAEKAKLGSSFCHDFSLIWRLHCLLESFLESLLKSSLNDMLNCMLIRLMHRYSLGNTTQLALHHQI